MQQDPLIPARDAQGHRNLVGTEARDVAHRDHLRLTRRQLLNGAPHDVERLTPKEHVLCQRAPIRRPSAPVAGGTEALGIHGRCVAIRSLQRRGRRHPRFAAAARDRRVHEDAEDPRLERRAELEAVDRSQDGQARLLHDLLRCGARAHVGACHRQHLPVVAVDEQLEGSVVTGAQPREQLRVLEVKSLIQLHPTSLGGWADRRSGCPARSQAASHRHGFASGRGCSGSRLRRRRRRGLRPSGCARPRRRRRHSGGWRAPRRRSPRRRAAGFRPTR